MRIENRVDHSIDAGGALPLVADPVREVDHQRHPPLRGEGNCPGQCVAHRAGGGDSTVGVVGDLEAEQASAGCHAVETGHAEEVVACGDPGHVRAVSRVVENQVEDRRAGAITEVGRHPDGRGTTCRPAERLVTDPEIAHRLVIGERAVAAAIGKEEPRRPPARHHHRQGVRNAAIGVEVGGGIVAVADLGHQSTPDGAAGHCQDATGTGERMPLHPDGVVGDPGAGEGDASLTGEVAQVEQFRGAVAGGAETVGERINAAVEDRDQDPAAVVFRFELGELVDPGGMERHQPGPVGGDGGLAAVGHLSRGEGRSTLHADHWRGWRGLRGHGHLGRGGDRDRWRRRRWRGTPGDQRREQHPADHAIPSSTNGPRWGPAWQSATRSRKASTSRVSSGSTIASTKPRAAAYVAPS